MWRLIEEGLFSSWGVFRVRVFFLSFVRRVLGVFYWVYGELGDSYVVWDCIGFIMIESKGFLFWRDSK